MKYLDLKKTTAIICVWALAVMPVLAIDIHVATNGDDNNEGTMDAPLLTIQKAMEIVQPGDRILVHEGTYMITNRIKIPALGTNSNLRCELRAWPDDAVGKVIIDGTNMNPSSEIEFKQSRCIYVNHEANYWTFYGLVLQNAKDNGMKIEGSYNIVERCTFRRNNNTGLQIGMFNDFTFEETQSFPISGNPSFNPNFSYCRYNKVINCDSYENADTKSFSDSDDGGDADGFAVKNFPGPGTEFHGCRAWTNSDDNWDLSMTYHPVVIDHCWAWHAGYMPNGSEGKSGDGFKLGGGGSAGGADYEHSVGAHVITNCVAFGNLHKGFDQNNAYEGMYIFNCVAWDNEYNYRFPTEFKYGAMDIHNCIGWGARAEKSGYKVGNHEFLSPNKDGYKDPTDGTTYNSWIEIDGCSPIKESYKPDDADYTPATQDHSGEFLSLSVADFQADREPDGSLPNNNFARLKPGSIFKDKGMPVIGFTPTRKMTEEECAAASLEYITADDIYILYNDDAPDFGAFELDGVPCEYTIPEKIKVMCTTANSLQEITAGQAIADIVYELNDVATDAVVEGLSAGLSYVFDAASHTVTISGTPQEECTFKLTATGNEAEGVKSVTVKGIISLATPYKVLTDDWYLFQDDWDAFPVDLQGVLELIQGDNTNQSSDGIHKKGDTYVDPNMEESGCSYSWGAVCLGQSNGGIKLNLDNGVLKLFLHAYFNADRKFKISYKLSDGTSNSITTKKYKKGSYEFDVLELLALTTEEQSKKIRTITFQLDAANGGACIYEMYVSVPDAFTTSISAVKAANGTERTMKMMENGRVAILKNGVLYNLQGQRLDY